MAESLGELIVKISADVEDLKKGLLDAQNQTKETADKIGEATKKVALSMTAMGAAITGAFTLMIKSSVEYSEELIILSQRTGISVESLSQLSYAAGQVGVSIGELANGMKFLEKNAFQAETGNEKLKLAFLALGISTRGANGQLIDATSLLSQMADRFKTLPDGPAKTALAMELMGRAGVNMIPILNLGSQGLKEMAARADALGGTLTTTDARAFKEFGDDTKSLTVSLNGLYRVIAADVTPAVDNFVKFVTTIIVDIRLWEQQHKTLSGAINNTALALGVLLTVGGSVLGVMAVLGGVFSKFGTVIASLLPILEGFGAAMAAFIESPLVLTGIILVTLAAAWSENWGGMRNVIRTIAVDIGNIIDGINEKFLFLTLFVQNSAENLKNNIKHPVDALKEAAAQAKAAIDALKQQQGGSLGNIGQSFGQGIDAAGKATDNFINKLKESISVIHQVGVASNQLAQTEQTNSQRTQAQLLRQEISYKINQQAYQKMAQDVVTLGSNIESSFSTALSNIIMGTESVKEAFKSLGMAIVKAIVDFVAQEIIAATIGKAIRAAETALMVAMGVTVAAAWAPAAALVSLATLGANAAPAAAGISSVSALAQALAIPRFAEGTDGVPAVVHMGEMIIPATFSDAIRKGTLTLSGNNSEGKKQMVINVTVNARIDHKIDIDTLGRQIGLNIEQKLRRIK